MLPVRFSLLLRIRVRKNRSLTAGVGTRLRSAAKAPFGCRAQYHEWEFIRIKITVNAIWCWKEESKSADLAVIKVRHFPAPKINNLQDSDRA
jgi:hypothetical protein